VLTTVRKTQSPDRTDRARTIQEIRAKIDHLRGLGGVKELPAWIEPMGREATEEAGSEALRPVPLDAGDMLQNYRIERILDRLRDRDLYEARNIVNDRRVAVELLFSTSEERPAKDMRREIEAVCRLRHPVFCTVYEVGEHAGAPYVVMEYLTGGNSLESVISAGEMLPTKVKLGIIRQVCIGLEYAHRNGLTCLDINPSKVILLRDGQVKLVGYWRTQLKDKSGLTRSSVLTEPIKYASPERLKGERADEGADIWSAGVMLYRLLSHRHPFSGSEAAEVADKILHQPFAPLASVLTEFPPGLDRVVGKALAKDPKMRYLSAEAMASDLQTIIASLPSERAGHPMDRAMQVVAEATQIEPGKPIGEKKADASREGPLKASPDENAPGTFTRLLSEFGTTGSRPPAPAPDENKPGGFTEMLSAFGGAAAGPSVPPPVPLDAGDSSRGSPASFSRILATKEMLERASSLNVDVPPGVSGRSAPGTVSSDPFAQTPESTAPPGPPPKSGADITLLIRTLDDPPRPPDAPRAAEPGAWTRTFGALGESPSTAANAPAWAPPLPPKPYSSPLPAPKLTNLPKPEPRAGSAASAAASSPELLDRTLDLALASSVPVLTPVEILALLRLPSSKSLSERLQEDRDTELVDAVRTRTFTMEFLRDAAGRLGPVDIIMRVNAPDFEPPSMEKKVRVRPDRDCERQTFLLTPQKAGLLRVQFELLMDDLSVASHVLKVQSETSDRLQAPANPVVISVPLSVKVKPRRRWAWISAAAAVLLIAASIPIAVHYGSMPHESATDAGRGFKAPPSQVSSPAAVAGKNYALLFATDDYRYWPHLNNPLDDARTIAAELHDNYGYSDTPPQVVSNPTTDDIVNTLHDYASRSYSRNDQLFIYFAGHGFYDEREKEGFLVGRDSKLQSEDTGHSTYLDFSRLARMLDNIPVDHIFVVLDVCYGGAFDARVTKWAGQRGDDYADVSNEKLVQRKLAIKGRLYLTSGQITTVPDGKAGHHSPFARRFIESLRTYGGKKQLLTASQIRLDVEKVEPEPRFGDFGDSEPGADFVFIPK
jgi:hypothetical protein